MVEVSSLISPELLVEIEADAIVNESAFYYSDHNTDCYNMSIENEDTPAKKVVRKNEKFNVPDQTEKEEAETHDNAPVEKFSRGRGD